MSSRSIRNRLLAALTDADFAVLEPQLEAVPIELRQILIEASEPIAHVYFVEQGIVSLLANTDHGRIEVGMVGPEGLAGVQALLGAERSPYLFLVQSTGTALRIEAGALREAMRARPELGDVLMRYVHTLLVQTAQTAYANASFGIEARLARWILMTHDRLGIEELPLTHEFLSYMLGTRRSSVTTAIHVLEGNGHIRATRGSVVVRDRAKLEELANDAYGLAEAEYERLFGKG